MNTYNPDWRAALRDWLTRNPKTMPKELRELRDEFVRHFPKERLGQLTLEQFALGHDAYRDSFCYWLERKTRGLGSIMGGSVFKFWVWWDADAKDWKWIKWLAVDSAQEALSAVLGRLVAAIEHVEQRNFTSLDELDLPSSLGLKPLHLYFPEQFIPIFSQAHLKHYLTLFGLSTDGGPCTQNRRLLEFLRQQPEFVGIDTVQMMRFLADCFKPPALPSPESRQIWKVAPGERAHLWKPFSEHGYIGIGWREIGDLSKFKSHAECAATLKNAGLGTGGATSIEYFVRQMKDGDLVVANKGTGEVIGLGIITGDYQYAQELAERTGMEYPNLRRVEWRVLKPVASPVKFAQQTVTKLSEDDLKQIFAAYRQKHLGDPELLRAIDALEQGDAQEQKLERALPHSRLDMKRSLNWIFYGPPGTGKTWSALHEVRQLLLAKNVGHAEARQYADALAERNQGELKRLAALIEGTGEQKEIGYWWATINPAYWDWDELFRKGTERWSRGRIQRNYEQIRPGDVLFGYTSSPKRQLEALARVTAIVKTKGGPTFEVEPIQRIKSPVELPEIKENAILKKSEPIRSHAMGTLFKLEVDEAAELERLLRAKGNDLKFSVKASPR